MPRFFNSSILSKAKCILIYTIVFLAFSISASARDVSLQWDSNSEPDLSHYVVYWGTSSGSYSNDSGNIGLITTYTCTLPDDGLIYYFAVTAVDEAGLESDYSNEVNTGEIPEEEPPIAVAGPDQNVDEGSIVYLDGSNSSDPGGSSLTYEWTQTGGPAITLNNSISSQASFNSPYIESEGVSLTFQLTVTNEGGLQSTDSCIVNIVSVNNPPAANAGPDQNVEEGSLVYLDGSNSSDPDGDSLTYLWIQTDGISVTLDNPASVQPLFDSPYIATEGESLTFQITVTDEHGLQSTDSCIVNIVSVNNPPAADAGPDQNINEGSMGYLNGANSSDPDGDSLTYLWTQTGGTSVTLDDPASIQPGFDSPYIETEGESLVFQLTVTDEHGLQATDNCIVNIVSVNNPPSASAGPDQTVDEGAVVTLNGTGSNDPDGDVLSFKWIQTGGTSVTLSNSLTAAPVFEAFYVDPEGESLTFQLTVTDEHGLQSTDTCIVNITWVNDPPIADAGPDQNVDEGSSVTLNGSGSNDPDGDTLTYSWTQVSGPAVALSFSNTASPTIDIPYINTDGESLIYQLTVTDEGGLQSTDSCVVNIVSVNNPPQADAGPDQNAYEGSSAALNGSGSSDPDGDTLTYNWTQVSGPAVSLTDTGSAQAAFTAPDVDIEGAALVFQLTVADEGGLQSTDSCTVNILNVNNAPSANAGTDQTVDEGSSAVLNGSGSSDPDGDTLTYNWTQVSGPAVSLTNTGSAQAAFTTPDVGIEGAALVFQLTVADEGGLQSTDSCTVNVLNVNNAPSANAGTDQTVDEGSSVGLNGSGSSDPDGDTLTYNWTQVSGPSVTLNNSDAIQAGFTAPGVDKEGAILVFQLTVTDEGSLSSTDTCVVNISWVNESPTASAGLDQTVDEGSSVELNGSGSNDPDGDTLTYNWTQVSGPAVSLTNTGSAQAAFTAPDVGIEGAALVFQLTVTDEEGLQSTDSCTVNILNVNHAPSANAGTGQTVDEGSSAVLNGSGSSDPDGDTLTYNWTQVSGPAVSLTNTGSAQAAFTAPDVDKEGAALVFQLTVSDEEGLQSTDSCTVNILNVNIAPTANAGTDQTVDEGSSVGLNGSGSSDPDGDTLTYIWTQVSGPAVSLTNSGSIQATFTAPDVDSEGATLVFELTVADEDGLESTESCIVNIVYINNAPSADAGPDKTVDEGLSVALNGSGSSDPDSGTLTYNWTQISGPAVSLTDAGSAQAAFTAPDVDSEGAILVFQLTVTDEGGLQSTDSCIINISFVNEAPSANAGPDQSVNEGTVVTLNGSGSGDPDGDILSYKWTQVSGSAVTLTNSESAQASFVSPDVNAGGAYATFQLTVTDPNGLQSTDRCIVNILFVNEAPLADAGPDQAVDEGTQVTLDGSGSSDPDSDMLTYEWIQLSGPVVSLNDPEALRPVFVAPTYLTGDDNTLIFQLTVTDAGGLKSSDQCSVTITDTGNIDLTGSWDYLIKYWSWAGRTYVLDGLFTVHNEGDLINKSFNVSFYLSADNEYGSNDILIYDQSIESMGANESVDISLDQIENNNIGRYRYLICRIDCENTIAEENENNNLIASVIKIDYWSFFRR